MTMLNVPLSDDETHAFNGSTDDQHCHYDDIYYPISKQCGIDICHEQGMDPKVLKLKFGWSDSWVQLRKYNAMSLLYQTSGEYEILPDILYLNTILNQDDYMIFENETIIMGQIEMDIAYFCCYDDEEYQRIN